MVGAPCGGRRGAEDAPWAEEGVNEARGNRVKKINELSLSLFFILFISRLSRNTKGLFFPHNVYLVGVRT